MVLDREDDPAFGAPVEFGQHHPRQLRDVVEEQGLADAVLAGRGVQDKQRLVRGLGVEFAGHGRDLAEFLHQVPLRLEPPGRVDDHYVRATGSSGRDRVVRDRARVGARGLADELRP